MFFEKDHLKYRRDYTISEETNKERNRKISSTITDKWQNDLEFIKKHKIGSKKTSKILKTKYETGELIIWNKELTKEIDKRVEKLGKNTSIGLRKAYKNGFVNPFKDKKHTKKTKNRIGSWSKKRWASLSEEDRQEFIKFIHSRRTPSSPELKFIDLCEKFNLPFKYIGDIIDKKIVIGGKVPDFIHESENKLIEIFGDYWHKGNNPQDRIDFFKKYGYECLVIWASELKDVERIVERCRNF